MKNVIIVIGERNGRYPVAVAGFPANRTFKTHRGAIAWATRLAAQRAETGAQVEIRDFSTVTAHGA